MGFVCLHRDYSTSTLEKCGENSAPIEVREIPGGTPPPPAVDPPPTCNKQTNVFQAMYRAGGVTK